ncbi:DUF11 domain-containing protein [Roseateles oligotrophus]|uniref:DUF11 domain-containing protein n=1 Tax=Roseateles oligotrophus TaxID=1769250 RepID=A0ABT2YJP3_9BURK|nr:DUF11 domain-containing protein [Roseateles oligotrophus]MCV2370277.1 DUF11 domain-containing protein [Roseateles oligotrophus]
MKLKPRLFLFCLFALALSACGGGGSEGGGAANSGPPSQPPPSGPAVRVEVEPAALLLTGLGQQQSLQARAFDSEGRLVSQTVTWQSSKPAEVEVGANGTVRAAVAAGSGQVFAVVDGVRSAPVVVAVAQAAAGVTLLTDAQVMADPVAVEAGAEPDNDKAYEVVLSGLPLPAVGSLLLGREGKSIGGEVLAASQENGNVRVRLKTVGLDRLLQSGRLQETVDLAGLPLQVPADLQAMYDVRLQDGEYIFTPKPGATGSGSGMDERRKALSLRKFNLGPFACELVGSELPISMPQPVSFNIKFVPRYVLDYERSTGLRKLLLQAEASFKMKTNLQVNVAGLVNLTCEKTLLQRLVPMPGVFGLLVAGELQAGMGFETEGSVRIPLLGAEFTVDAKGRLEAGLDCSLGTCRMVSDWKPEASSTTRFITPGQALAEARSEFSVYGYGFAKLRVGMTLVSELRIDAVGVRAGPKFEANLAPAATQLAAVDPGLPDYRSDYKLHLLVEGSVGSLNKGETALRALLQKLGIFKVTLLKVQLSLPLGDSPKGTASMSGANAAKDGEFIDGKTLSFQVKLDPKTARFPGLGYNVRRVIIYFIREGMLPLEVASMDAAADQTAFELTWVAQGTAGASGRSFAAFVDTVLPLPVSLELAKAQQLPEVFRGRMTVTETMASPLPVAAGAPALSNKIGGSFRYFVDGEVELGDSSVLQAAALSTSAAHDMVSLVREPVKASNGCAFVKNTETAVKASGTGTSSGHGTLEIDRVAGVWRLAPFNVQLFAVGSKVERTFATERSLACTSPFFEQEKNTAIDEKFGHGFLFSSTASALRGNITVDADGRRAIRFQGTPVVNEFKTLALTLDLKEGPSRSASTDLSVELVATPTVKPAGTLTYSVNLLNQGFGRATDVRTEFKLPPGWSVLGQVGWSGCSSSLNTVVCRTEQIDVGERRAFLVDVQAPLALGLYTISARVSAAEIDTDLGNNRTETTSTIVE